MSYSFSKITIYNDDTNINNLYNSDNKFFVERVWLVKKIEQFKQNPNGRHLIIVGEPGSGKSTFMAYLAKSWNCPCHFIRVDNQSGAIGVNTCSFLISLGLQLYQKYGRDIFEQNISGTTTVKADSVEHTEIIGRFIDKLYTLPFLPIERNVSVTASQVSGQSKVIGEQIGELVPIAKMLPESTLLHVAVLDPIRKIQEIYPDETVVILVDALDESLQHTGKRIIDIIPKATDAGFPKNLRIVMTSRQGNHLVNFQDNHKLYLEKNAEQGGYRQEVLKDAQTYIKRRTEEEEPLSNVIKALPPNEKKSYIAEIEHKSDGNFLYLYYFFNQVVEIIKAGETNLRKIVIPKGLDEIYRFFVLERIIGKPSDVIKFKAVGGMSSSLINAWKEIEGVNEVNITREEVTLSVQDSGKVITQLFPLTLSSGVQINELNIKSGETGKKCIPILGVLAVAYEPLSKKQIAGFSSLESIIIDDVIAKLKQFLDEFQEEKENRYRFYHISLNEYLLDSSRNRDHSLNEAEYHSKIASYYQKESESWENINWENINSTNKDEYGEYGFLHLTKHLNAAGRQEELYTLLTGSPKWMKGKSNNLGNAAYVDDLELAINNFNDPVDEPKQLVTLVKLYTALQVVNQRVSIHNLKTLVWLGHKTEALSHARLMSDPKSKFDALMTIHDALTEKKQLDKNLLNEAEKVAERIQDNLTKAKVLAQLATALFKAGHGGKAEDLFSEAEKVAQEIQDDYNKAKALNELATALATAKEFPKAEEVLAKAEKATRTIIAYRYQAEVLGELADVLIKIGYRTKAKCLLNEAQEVISKDKDGWRQAEVLIKLSVTLAQIESNETNLIFNKVEQIANTIPADWRRVDILIKLAIALAQTEHKNEAKGILAKVTNAKTINEDKWDLKGKLAVAQAHTENFSEAGRVAMTIQSKLTQVKVLSQLVVIAHKTDENEAREFFAQSQNIANTIEEGWNKVGALNELAKALEEVAALEEVKKKEIATQVEEIATQAGKIEREVKEGWRKPGVLSKLATVLAKAEYDDNKVSAVFREAEKAARNQKEKLHRAEDLSKLAVALVQSGREAQPILTELDEVIQEILDPEKKASSIRNEAELRDAMQADFQKSLALIQLTEALAQVQSLSKVEKIADKIQNDDELKAEILSKLAVGLAKAKDFSEAEEVIQKIEQKSAKAWAMSKLAAELAKTNDQEANNIFSKAKQIALDIEEDNSSKPYLLIELAADLANIGEFFAASKIINLITDDYAKSIGLSQLATAYALVENFTEAENIISEIQKISITIKGGVECLKISKNLSVNLAQLKFFKQAFSIFKLKVTASEFLTSLIELQSAFDLVKSGLTAYILQESIRILAWEHIDWRRINIIFCSNTKFLLENQNE